MSHQTDESTLSKKFGPPPEWAIYLALFLLAFVPRVLALDAYVASDEAKWILRSAHFLTSLRSGDFGAAASQIATPEVDVLAPAVTTMWSGSAGLLAKYLADGQPVPLDDYLAALPYGNSEKIPLPFYPWLRFPTVLITSLFIPAFYFFLRKLLNSRTLPFIAAALLALDPFFINYSRVIHHDALVTVFSVLSLLSVMVYLRDYQRHWLFFSGIMLGMALLTKPTSLILIPFTGLMFLWQIYRTRCYSLIGWGVVWALVGGITVVALWPALWVDPLGTLTRLTETSTTGAGSQNDFSLLPALIPNRLPEPGFLFYPLNLVFVWGILPTLGLLLVLVTVWRGKNSALRENKPIMIWLALFAALLMLALTPLQTRDIRYFMPAWPIIMMFAAAGLLAFKRWLTPTIIIVAAIVLLIPYYPYYITYLNPLILGPYLAPHVIKLGGGVGLDHAGDYLNSQPDAANKTAASYILEGFQPYFTGNATEHKSGNFADYSVYYLRQIQNQYPSTQNLAYFAARQPDHTVTINGVDYAWVYLLPPPQLVKDVSFGEITLIAQTIDARTVEPGSQHQLTLLWNAPPQAANTPVTVELRDPAGTVWSDIGGPLIAPGGPSTVEGHYLLNFPPDMPRGNYELWIAAGQGVEPQKVTGIGAYSFTPPDTISHPVQANFNNSIELAGFDINTFNPIPGESLQINLYWHALQNMVRPYTNFIHLIDANGNPVAQADIIPGNGAAPTDIWQPDEWLTDTIALNLPTDLPPGKYDILLGWYYWETLERLPLVDQGNDFLYLTSVEIQ